MSSVIKPRRAISLALPDPTSSGPLNDGDALAFVAEVFRQRTRDGGAGDTRLNTHVRREVAEGRAAARAEVVVEEGIPFKHSTRLRMPSKGQKAPNAPSGSRVRR